MKKMRNAWLGLCLVVLALASCDFPRLSKLADGNGGGDDTAIDGGVSSLSLELLAGDIGGNGNADGTDADARFFAPAGAAVDSAGNVYVTDYFNHTIRKITSAGIVTTLAGTAGIIGSADGTGAAAQFNTLSGVAVDGAGNIYATDGINNTIRKVTPAGVVTTLAGTAGTTGSTDGTGAAARFNQPSGIAVDSTNCIYIADAANDTIRKITPAGVVTTLAGTAGTVGSVDGAGAAARFNNPFSLTVDGASNVYVADKFNSTIRKITVAGVVTTLAGTAGMYGSVDGAGGAARFSDPDGVAVDSAGNVYVADANTTIRRVTAAGSVTTMAGTAGITGSTDGTGATARFNGPEGIAVDSAGNVYVADSSNDIIRKIAPAGAVTTLAGIARMNGSVDGAGFAARFNNPTGLAADGAGNVYVADRTNATIRKVTAAGVVTTWAGAAGMLGSADGIGNVARFERPIRIAVDSVGNFYVADQFNNTIRKATAGGVVTTLAGIAGVSGSADGTGNVARFSGPNGVAVDVAGNIYVADQLNNTIRKVTIDGTVTTLAGTAGSEGSADGTGASAGFVNPLDVVVDGSGNVYVADTFNHIIRKITTAGVVTTLAGTAGMIGSEDGTSAEARFHTPSGVAIDSTGNIYVADTGNSTIRKITPTGNTTTIAGTVGVTGILLGTTPRFARPQDLTIVGDSIVVSDANAILLLRHGVR